MIMKAIKTEKSKHRLEHTLLAQTNIRQLPGSFFGRAGLLWSIPPQPGRTRGGIENGAAIISLLKRVS